jgi:hypothetical protein
MSSTPSPRTTVSRKKKFLTIENREGHGASFQKGMFLDKYVFLSILRSVFRRTEQLRALAMAEDLESKTKRVRDLLSSFYGDERSDLPPSLSPRTDTIHAINSRAFDAERYMHSLVRPFRSSAFLFLSRMFLLPFFFFNETMYPKDAGDSRSRSQTFSYFAIWENLFFFIP